MKREEHEKIINSIQEKLGDESSSLIADDLGILITDNVSMNETIENKNNEITKLQSDKEMLVTTNGNLLKQVGMGVDTNAMNENKNEKVEKKEFSFKSIFDEKGNFIH